MTKCTAFRHAARFVLILPFALSTACGAGDPGETADGEHIEEAEVGTAEQAVSGLGAKINVSSPLTVNVTSPAAGWIKSSFTDGNALIGFTNNASTPKAGWNVSQGGWALTSPSWGTARLWDAAGFVWPDPANLCDVWSCSPTPADWTAYNSVGSAVWTGLNNVAALVGTGGANGSNNTDVYVVTSTNGGVNFTKSRILSILDAMGEDSGGDIDPESVHASLMVTAGRRNSTAGSTPIYVYVIWRNSFLMPSWWMTRFLVGVDGTVAQTDLPRKVTAVPAGSFGSVHAVIQAWTDDIGREIVEVFWSERTDGSGAPVGQIACPSATTITVRWFGSFSLDFGTTWGCQETTSNCTEPKLLLNSDTAWRPCVGGSFGSSGTAFNVNNDRPEYAVNRGAPYEYYLAINKNVGGKQKVVVMRDAYLWGTVFTSSGVDPATGVLVSDSWGQALTIHQGNSSKPATLAVTWKNSATTSGQVSTAAVTSANFGVSWSAENKLSSTQWAVANPVGLYQGVMVKEVCVDGTCPGGPPPPSRQPFLAAWPGNEVSGSANEAWARKFSH